MVRIGIVGVGRMGLSHLAIANAHPSAEIAYVCDRPGPMMSALKAYTPFPQIGDYRKAIAEGGADAIIVATPTGTHVPIAEIAIANGQHVFVEKPFCLDPEGGEAVAEQADSKGLFNQVGYHNRFVGTFREARRLLAEQALGRIHHVHGEAYGQVVIRPQTKSWRFSSKEEGGCLLDYASHVIDLMNFLVGPASAVSGSVLQNIYSKAVDDAVYATLHYPAGHSGQISVNWSDESYRKMSTRISVQGDQGKIIVDRQELRVHMRSARPDLGLQQGWNIRYITELTDPVGYYLRGEEYSAQIDAFITGIKNGAENSISSFRTALETDRLVEMVRADASGSTMPNPLARPDDAAKQGGVLSWIARIFGGRARATERATAHG